jgi:hypothetical protein
MYFLQYSRDKEDENGQAFLGINIFTPPFLPRILPYNPIDSLPVDGYNPLQKRISILKLVQSFKKNFGQKKPKSEGQAIYDYDTKQSK